MLWRPALLPAPLTYCAAFGIALLAAWVAESLLRKRFRQAALRAAVAVVPVIFWQAHIWRVTSSAEYRRPAYGYQRAAYAYSYESQWQVLDLAMEWLRQHAGPDDVIASTVPHLTYLRSARRAVLPPMETDPELSRRFLDEVPVKYLLLDELGKPGISERYAAPVVERWRDEWKLVYSAPGGGARIYEHID